MRYLLFLCLILLSQSSLLCAQEADLLRGQVMRLDKNEVVAYVNVVNLSKGQGTAATEDGRFQIPASISDTIILSAIGYAELRFVVSEKSYSQKVFRMKALQYDLDEITVYGFNHDPFEPRKIDRRRYPVRLPGIPGSDAEFSPYKPSLMSPISLLYEQFSRKERLKREGWAFVNRMEILDRLDTLFSNPVLADYIDLEGSDLELFKRYCMLDPDFYLSRNDYVNLLVLKERLFEYQAIRRRFR